MGYNRVLGHFTNSQELAVPWQTGQLYLVNQVVINSNLLYLCNTQHTSGATFAGDSIYWTGLNPAATIGIAQGGTGQTTQTAAFDALSPTTTAGDLIVYNGTDNVRFPLGTDGQALVVDNSLTNKVKWTNLAQGAKNYFSTNTANPTFSNNSVSPWSACTLTFSSGVPSGAPTLTATQMAIAATVTNPLLQSQSNYNLQLVKSGAAQYQGFISGELTIDREDLAKVLTGSFSYEVVTGPVTFSGTSTQDLEIWVYNTVSGAWTQPAGFRGMNTSSGTGVVSFTFQTDSTAANNKYKIAVITQQTSGTGYTVNFNDFSVGPTAVINGTPVTDWVSYTPTLTGFGTATNVQFQWRRVGDNVEVRGKFTSGTSTAVEGRASLPSLTSADTSKIASLQLVGMGATSVTASNSRTVLIEPSVGYVTFGISSAGPLAKQNGSVLLASGDTMSFFALVPVQGWSSNVQISSDTDTRVVAAAANTLSSTTLPANAALLFNTTTVDTHGAITTGAGYKYTVPVSGNYRISCSFPPITAGSGSLYAAKNGSFTFTAQNFITSASTSHGGGGSIVLPLVSGDTIQFSFNSAATASSVNANFAIERLSGPSVVAASETVAASYWLSASFAASTTVPINFDSKEYDSHNAVTTSATAWKFTAPISGLYTIKTKANITTVTTVISNIYKNGAILKGIGFSPNGQLSYGSMDVRLNAGDYIDIRPDVSISYAGTTLAGNSSQINIVRVGN
jgi:hypothetical protein